MIFRNFDADLHNRIANHPEVRPTFGYHEGPTDLSPLLEHPEAYFLLSDNDAVAMLFEWSAPDVWQGHIMALPEARGKRALNAAKAMCRLMFEQYGAKMLWCMAPERLPAVKMFSRLTGFKEAGGGEDAAGVQVRFFVMEK